MPSTSYYVGLLCITIKNRKQSLPDKKEKQPRIPEFRLPYQKCLWAWISKKIRERVLRRCWLCKVAYIIFFEGTMISDGYVLREPSTYEQKQFTNEFVKSVPKHTIGKVGSTKRALIKVSGVLNRTFILLM